MEDYEVNKLLKYFRMKKVVFRYKRYEDRFVEKVFEEINNEKLRDVEL